MKKWHTAFSSEELKTYLLVILSATVLISVNTYSPEMPLADTVRHAFFQVSSLMTSTGYATADFDLWPTFSKVILVLLMIIGACAGSTGGGIKVSRILIFAKKAKQELHRYIYPNRVTKIKIEGKPLEEDIITSTSAYLITYVFLFVASVLLLSFEGHDLTTLFTATLTTINNMGPGLSLVGPTQNFGFFSDFSKLVLSFNMLAGRLELFPILILLNPRIWFQKKI